MYRQLMIGCLTLFVATAAQATPTDRVPVAAEMISGNQQSVIPSRPATSSLATDELTQQAEEVSDHVAILDQNSDQSTTLLLDNSSNFSSSVVRNSQGRMRSDLGSPNDAFLEFSGGGLRVGLFQGGPDPSPGSVEIVSDEFPLVHFSDIASPAQTWNLHGDNFSFSISAKFSLDPTTPETMRVDSNGRVGIGTPDPAAKLHVVTESFINDLRLRAGPEEFRDLKAFSDGGFQIDDKEGRRSMRIFPGTPDNALVLRNGRVGLNAADPQADLHVAGSARIDGDVALGSSRTLKTGFGPVSPAEMLARVADLPVASWRYKSEDETTRHIGPFAEDFQRLFGVGDGETISVIDAQGVTLAAIQGLQQELAEKDAQIEVLTARLTAIETRLERPEY